MTSNHPRTDLTIHPPPEGEAASEDYTIRVAGVPVFAYCARVSAVPFNQVWPGYQRPLDQTELAAFVSWDMAGPVEVEVVSKRPVSSAVIRPLSLGISPKVDGDRITFTLPRPAHFVLEVNGSSRALHLFANLPEKARPAPDAPGIRYFGPGVHRPGKIKMESGQTIYIAGGAVVHGVIEATGAQDIRILGRGILDASSFERDGASGMISLCGCSRAEIDGIILRDPNVWTVIPANCEHVAISNLKLIGLWRYNADGIDLVNSRHVTIADCFVRSFDDSIVIKGLKGWGASPTGEQPVSDVQVRGCVVWNDWGRALEIGAETAAPVIENVRYTDCDIIHSVHVVLDVQNGNQAAVRNVCYEDIRVEMDDGWPTPRLQAERDEHFRVDPGDAWLPRLLVLEVIDTMWLKGTERGSIDGVVLKDIRVTAPRTPPSELRGFDAAHGVQNVRIENLRINGRAAAGTEKARIELRKHVKDVQIRPS